jgi:hypothetical protein
MNAESLIKEKFKNIIKLEKKIKKFDIDDMGIFYLGYINGKAYVAHHFTDLLATNKDIVWGQPIFYWFDIDLAVASLIAEEFVEPDNDEEADEDKLEKILRLSFICGINDSFGQLGIFVKATNIDILDNYEIKIYHLDTKYIKAVAEPFFLLDEENQAIQFNYPFAMKIKNNKKIIDMLGE